MAFERRLMMTWPRRTGSVIVMMGAPSGTPSGGMRSREIRMPEEEDEAWGSSSQDIRLYCHGRLTFSSAFPLENGKDSFGFGGEIGLDGKDFESRELDLAEREDIVRDTLLRESHLVYRLESVDIFVDQVDELRRWSVESLSLESVGQLGSDNWRRRKDISKGSEMRLTRRDLER
jgi:hypothetical protein